MKNFMDNFFISIGFEAQEVKLSPHRGGLYFGMIFLLGAGLAFAVMALFA